MNKGINYYGIDISKDVFDVMSLEGNYFQYENNFKGFKKFFNAFVGNFES